ncbi:MAG: AhpC/TSA family protein [Bacteroidia bacterium]|nr:AhpC/TSA family protein [Bacteroidia bacterium]NNF30516.1 AhpC/TSA family protein [Flavobacteriaceae bacterium]MBT8274752.1 AhpC/TSA family protein [Bacteroidia bacterium]NNJ81008.1 AhpC/TSA family protein [Flavobacteriaceae bacterium]NNK53836.1 AhpC/TSA family protein [Flavobacteriaceae bacterium]
MRRYFALLITIILFSCAEDSNSYKLNGSAEGFEDGTQIIVYSLEDNNQPEAIDTLTVQKGKFSARYPKTDKLLLGYLSVQNPQGSVVFFPENEDLRAILYKDSMVASYVSGSRQNEMYTAFKQKIREFNNKKQSNSQRFQQARQEQDNLLATEIQKENVQLGAEETNYKLNFINENNTSLFSLMLATEMLGRKEMSADQAAEFVKNLPPKTASAQLAAGIKNTIDKMKRADVGGMAPDFAAPTPQGEMLSLKETLGKYTIIDFWASWCKPCRRENPNVVRVYEKYHDKGLNIISVSLDREGQKERWVQAIEDDNMNWYHVSNLKFWQDPIARQYNVRSIPATFLLDESGKIIAKNLRGPALETKIASLLGQ